MAFAENLRDFMAYNEVFRIFLFREYTSNDSKEF